VTKNQAVVATTKTSNGKRKRPQGHGRRNNSRELEDEQPEAKALEQVGRSRGEASRT
jgi:hypothetical protein